MSNTAENMQKMADSFKRYELVRDFLLAKGIKEAPLNRIMRKYRKRVLDPAVERALIDELSARFAEVIDAEIIQGLMGTPLRERSE